MPEKKVLLPEALPLRMHIDTPVCDDRLLPVTPFFTPTVFGFIDPTKNRFILKRKIEFRAYPASIALFINHFTGSDIFQKS